MCGFLREPFWNKIGFSFSWYLFYAVSLYNKPILYTQIVLSLAILWERMILSKYYTCKAVTLTLKRSQLILVNYLSIAGWVEKR